MVGVFMFSRLRSNIVVLWIVRLLALPMIALLYAAGFVLNLLYGIGGSIGMILAGLGGFAAFLALLDGSYAQAAASALVALLLCPFAAPMLLSLAGSALIVAASALFAWPCICLYRVWGRAGFSFLLQKGRIPFPAPDVKANRNPRRFSSFQRPPSNGGV